MRSAERLRRGVLHRRVELRDEREQDLLEVEEDVLHLVAHARPLLADLVGLPQRRDLFADRAIHVDGLGRRELGALSPRHQRHEAPMFLEHGPALRLAGMRREDELDGRFGEQLDEALARRLLRHAGEDDLERSRLRLALARVVAAAARAVMLLREVDELEVVGEGAGDALGHAGVEPAHDVDQLLRRRASAFDVVGRVLRAPRLRERADGLLEVEELLTLLLDERVAQDPSEIRDIAPERVERERHRERQDRSSRAVLKCDTTATARKPRAVRALGEDTEVRLSGIEHGPQGHAEQDRAGRAPLHMQRSLDPDQEIVTTTTRPRLSESRRDAVIAAEPSDTLGVPLRPTDELVSSALKRERPARSWRAFRPAAALARLGSTLGLQGGPTGT